MEQLCGKIADKMIRGGLIEADKKDWMVYILQKWILKCIGVGLFLILLGLVIGWLNALAFYVVVANLRAYAGGWHASKAWVCLVVSSAIALAVGLAGPLIVQWSAWVHIVAAAVSVAVLLLLAPVQPENLPLTAAERAVNRRKMLGILAIVVACFILTEVLCIKDISAYIAIALTCVTVTVLAAWLVEQHSISRKQT